MNRRPAGWIFLSAGSLSVLAGGLQGLWVRWHHAIAQFVDDLDHTTYLNRVASHGAWLIYAATLPLVLAAGTYWFAERRKESILDLLAAFSYLLGCAALFFLDANAWLAPVWPQLPQYQAEFLQNLGRVVVIFSMNLSSLLLVASEWRANPAGHKTPFALGAQLSGILTLGAFLIFWYYLRASHLAGDPWARATEAVRALAVPGAYALGLPSLGLLSSIAGRDGKASPRLQRWMKILLFSVFLLGVQRLARWEHMGDTISQLFMASMALPVAALCAIWWFLLRRRRGSYSLTDDLSWVSVGLMIAGTVTGLAMSWGDRGMGLQGTAFQVAHFHMVLLGGPILAMLASATCFTERLAPAGQRSVPALALFSGGLVITYLPLFIAGWMGVPRRIPVTPHSFRFLTLSSSFGAAVLTVGTVWIVWKILANARSRG